MNQRPTPETDLEEANQTQRFSGYMVKADFARRLERERDEAREELEAWRNAAKDARKAFAIVTDQLVQAQMDNRKVREELTTANETLARLQEWHDLTDAGLCLRLGELDPQETRTVRAVLNAVLTP